MIFDMHCDTLSRIRSERKNGRKAALKDSDDLCVNLEKMKQGGYALQNFAVFIDLQERSDCFENAMEQVRIFEAEMQANSMLVRPVQNIQQIEKNRKEGLLSAMLMLEEGGACEGDLKKLNEFYQHGVRMVTLTWNYENELGYSAAVQEQGDSGKSYGLKQKGFEFLEEMERLHIIPDVSHLSDDGFWDVAAKCSGPFAASHSNARSLCAHFRNLSDEMLRCMGERGCVAGLNLYPEFLTASAGTPQDWLEAAGKHVLHMIEKGGTELVGLGSDFDGFGGGSKPEDAAKMQDLFWIFHKNGLSDDVIDRIQSGNVMRLYREILI